MPRYYFNIRQGGEVIKDPEGMELPDARAARQEALAGARDLVVDRIKSEQDIDGRIIEIADESGAVLDSFPIRKVLHGQ